MVFSIPDISTLNTFKSVYCLCDIILLLQGVWNVIVVRHTVIVNELYLNTSISYNHKTNHICRQRFNTHFLLLQCSPVNPSMPSHLWQQYRGHKYQAAAT